jgi:hypothetical protein
MLTTTAAGKSLGNRRSEGQEVEKIRFRQVLTLSRRRSAK